MRPHRPPITAADSRAKRLFDVVVSSILLITFAPLCVLIALAVRLSSSGPAIFRHLRSGLYGNSFSVLKFRTMRANAPDLRNPDGTTVSSPDDPRVTPIGRFLRAASLDELPQLINVLRGEMSIVGPRPETVDGIATYRPEHQPRLRVRPGMTGWAVIHGRNNVPLRQRRDLDAWYAQNWSFALDLRIIASTVILVLRRTGVMHSPRRP